MIINFQNLPYQTSSNYPEKFKHLVHGRRRKRLGKAAGLSQFGVNLVELEPGSCSSIRHYHLQMAGSLLIKMALLIKNFAEKIALDTGLKI